MIVVDTLVIVIGKSVNITDSASTNVRNVTSTVSINSDNKK